MYHKTVVTHMSAIQQATRTLVERGTQEDVPTGMTPRKRVWQYTDQWHLTKDREAILRGWREGGTSNAVLAAESEQESSEADPPHRTVNEPAPLILELPQVSGPMESPITMTLASSPSPTSCLPTPIPVPQHAPVLKKVSGVNKSGLPTMGTLTDRPTNVLLSRPRKVR
jgi:kinesin family protein 11